MGRIFIASLQEFSHLKFNENFFTTTRFLAAIQLTLQKKNLTYQWVFCSLRVVMLPKITPIEISRFNGL